MKVRLLSVASAELAEALAWYRERSPRAAEGFWLRVQEARRSIALFPLAAPPISRQARRFILSGYPYDLVYSVLADEIVVLAVAHHSRQPKYWSHRLRQVPGKVTPPESE
ncbi:MAG: type II toxin-antitoxin system RelE/ParE family toxin [Hydrogenophilales bacterium]|jgi:toxin ParE1/3/4|nr:type II toxin-antitoxin system RelE/ParE family toxin [Hydrogenophilales bacterium]